ncbi:hypothetical protein [Paenibacillus sp. L3-i20]|uniref:hypothetical protein n=1 Tax=Paenibacillus sp. L3-i20 TaxID=2905833 RepID=UPI00208D90AD|nr:hypothetical protein [Paenibacillus sp. L3-i20]GKU78856.1 hypothetical protein L3i20_v232530 [Paenibacillus sp. L3-i20]
MFSSCSQPVTNEVWLPSLNEAIEHGLKIEEVSLVLTQEYQNTHYVLVEDKTDAFSLAKINKSSKGYLWERITLKLGTPSYVMFEHTTETGEKLPILIGKTKDETTKKIKLANHLTSLTLDVHNGYYIGFNLPLNGHAYTVNVIK